MSHWEVLEPPHLAGMGVVELPPFGQVFFFLIAAFWGLHPLKIMSKKTKIANGWTKGIDRHFLNIQAKIKRGVQLGDKVHFSLILFIDFIQYIIVT
jgi:hypothetical protein